MSVGTMRGTRGGSGSDTGEEDGGIGYLASVPPLPQTCRTSVSSLHVFL